MCFYFIIIFLFISFISISLSVNLTLITVSQGNSRYSSRNRSGSNCFFKLEFVGDLQKDKTWIDEMGLTIFLILGKQHVFTSHKQLKIEYHLLVESPIQYEIVGLSGYITT